MLESDQPGVLNRLADRLRDLRSDVAATAGGTATTAGDDGAADDGAADDALPVTVFRIERNGPAWFTHPWGVWRDGEPCETTVTDDYIEAYVIWEVTRLVIEDVPPAVSVHAGAVAHGGRGLLLAGPSHSGKSTLTAALVERGFGFLTDELAVLDLDHDASIARVRPFWRPVGLRRGGPLDALIDVPGAGEEVLVPASAFGALSGHVPLAAIVLPRHLPGEDGDPVLLEPPVALTELVPQVPDMVGDRVPEVFAALAELVTWVPSYSLAVDDLSAAARRLTDLLDSSSTAAEAPTQVTTP